MKSTKWITLLCASVMACSMSVSAAPFDAVYYAENNPDVVEQVGYDAEKLAQHYYMIGITEGRMGNAEDAAKKDRPEIVSFQDFDPEYYVQQNPDLAEYGTDAYALYRHYISYGAEEGRMPSKKAKEEAEAKAKAEAEAKAKAEAEEKAKSTVAVKKSKKKKSKSKSKEEPTHTLTYQSNEDGTHDIICSVPDCSKGHNKTEACDTWYEQDSDEHHDHGDDIHYVICKSCGYKDSESCKLDYKYIDRKQHEITCTLCGYSEVFNHFPIYDYDLQKRFCEGCEGECD